MPRPTAAAQPSNDAPQSRNPRLAGSRSGRSLVIPIMLIGSTLWGLYWLPLRWLEQSGLSGLWALAVIYLGGTAVLGLLARRQLRTILAMPWRFTGIGLSAAVSGIAFGLGMLHGDVARVMILFYLSPVWAVLLGRVLLGERILPVTVPALALALFGAGLMLLSDHGLGGHAGGNGAGLGLETADLLGLLAGLGFALTNVQLRAATEMPGALKNLATVLLVPLLAGAAALALGSGASGPWWVVPAALGLGALWLSSMISATQYGIVRLPLQQSSVLLLFELIVGAVSAALLAGETLGGLELSGGVCIVLAGLAVVWSRAERTKSD